MKKILFTLLLAGIYFSSHAAPAIFTRAATANQSSYVVAIDDVASATSLESNQVAGQLSAADFDDCTFTAKITVTENGVSKTVEVKVTVKGTSCVDLLKAAIKAIAKE